VSNYINVPNYVQTVKSSLRYGDFSVFQDGSRRHLGFLNFLKI